MLRKVLLVLKDCTVAMKQSRIVDKVGLCLLITFFGDCSAASHGFTLSFYFGAKFKNRCFPFDQCFMRNLASETSKSNPSNVREVYFVTSAKPKSNWVPLMKRKLRTKKG